MAKHDLKAHKIQVERILNKQSTKVYADTPLAYAGSISLTDPDHYITRAVAEGLLGDTLQKTRLVVTGDFSIDWQNDIVPGTALTYLAVHGNSLSVMAFFTDGAIKKNYTPSVSFTEDGSGSIDIVTFSDVFAGLIIIT